VVQVALSILATNQSATDCLNYVASIFARRHKELGDGDGEELGSSVPGSNPYPLPNKTTMSIRASSAI
jgi:hypothetical protein